MTLKIDENGLRNLYQAGVACKERISRNDCPSPKTLMRLLRSKLSSRKATKIIDHLSGCAECASEFQFLLQVLRHERTLIQDLGKLMAKGKEVPDSEKAKLRLFPRLSRSTALAIAGSITLVVFISIFVISRAPERYRSGSTATIELLRPSHERISLSSLVFEWKAAGGVDHYSLELLDETLLSLWESGPILQTRFVLPAEATLKLRDGQSYFWTITAHLQNGENTKSALGQFTLIK